MIVCDRCKKPFPALAGTSSNIEPLLIRASWGACDAWNAKGAPADDYRLHCCAGCRELLRLALAGFVEDFSIADRGWLPELDAAPVAEAALPPTGAGG